MNQMSNAFATFIFILSPQKTECFKATFHWIHPSSFFNTDQKPIKNYSNGYGVAP